MMRLSGRSGKTSILNTVLDDMEPAATVYNESTREPWTKRFKSVETLFSPHLNSSECLSQCSAFLDFEFWDMPGGRYDIERLTNFNAPALGSCIFVIDAQVCYAVSSEMVKQAELYILTRLYKGTMPIKRESELLGVSKGRRCSLPVT